MEKERSISQRELGIQRDRTVEQESEVSGEPRAELWKKRWVVLQGAKIYYSKKLITKYVFVSSQC